MTAVGVARICGVGRRRWVNPSVVDVDTATATEAASEGEDNKDVT